MAAPGTGQASPTLRQCPAIAATYAAPLGRNTNSFRQAANDILQPTTSVSFRRTAFGEAERITGMPRYITRD